MSRQRIIISARKNHNIDLLAFITLFLESLTMASNPPSGSVNIDKLLASVRDSVNFGTGRGESSHMIESVLSKHDRFGSSPIQLNSELVGLTFFTRPQLNLSTTSLRQDPQLAMLDIIDPLSLMFSLRCNLDTRFMRSAPAEQTADISPWVNTESPFNIPLGNSIVGMSGWPDFNVEYETTESGYYAEDMTLVRGSDRGRRTYDISCTFRDIQGGYIMAYFFYWLHAMALQMEGVTVAYPEDRAANRLNYTVSIYRFILDPSMRTITKWAKATGCYPVSLPIGDVFNFNPGDSHIPTAQQFTIPFKVNNVSYMDPRHLLAFNSLVKRYMNFSEKDFGSRNSKRIRTKAEAQNNFSGIPWIDTTDGTNELMWLAKPAEVVNRGNVDIENMIKTLGDSRSKQIIDRYTTNNPTGETNP